MTLTIELYSNWVREVKSPPGSLRAERAAVTRRRIEEAARRLFSIDGYGATTLRGIADAAGVAVQTVYAVYGSKPNVLRALRESVRDDPAAGAAYARALDEADPARALEAFAASIRLRWERGSDIVTTHIEAASVEPDIRSELAAILETRRRGIGRLAATLATRVPGLDPHRAAAIIDALSLPELYAELSSVHGWSPDDYESWLAETMRRAILPGGSSDA